MRFYKASFVPTFIIFCIVIADRVSKNFFSQFLFEGESIAIIRNVFHVTLVHNTGIAFGFFKDHGLFFIFFSIIIIIFLSIYLYRNIYHNHLPFSDMIAFSFIIAGAIGNLLDRIMFGYVIDFFDFRIWPVFNIADSAITIGTFILVIKCIPSFSR